MASSLLGGKHLINPQEDIFNTIKQNELFRQEDYEYAKGTGNLDMYSAALLKGAMLPTLDMMEDEYEYFDLMDPARRILAIENEAAKSELSNNYSDRVISKWDDTIQNDDGTVGAYKDETVNMNDYEYNKYILDQWAEYKSYEIDRELMQQAQEAAEQEKAEHPIRNFFGSVGSFFLHLFSGVADFFSNVGQFFTAFGYGVKGGVDSNETFADNFRKAYEEGYGRIGVFDDFKDFLNTFDAKYTYFANRDGTNTTLGNILAGTTESIGNMLPSLITTIATGGAAAPVALAGKIVSVASYTTSMWNARMQEKFNDPKFATVPVGAIIGQTALATALDTAVEIASGRIFGGNIFDRAVFGAVATKGAGPAMLKFLKQTLVEGVEESVQEFTEYFSEFAFSLTWEEFTNTDFGIQSMIDAFIMGSLASALMTGVDITLTKNNYRTDANGNIRKFNRLSSWGQNLSWSNLMQQYESALKSKTMSNEDMLSMMQQSYLAGKTFSEMYGALGKDRMTTAMNLLDRMQEFVKQNKDNARISEEAQKEFNENYKKGISSLAKNVSELHAQGIYQTLNKQQRKTKNVDGKVSAPATTSTTSNENVITVNDVNSIFEQIRSEANTAVEKAKTKSKSKSKTKSKTDTATETTSTQATNTQVTKQTTDTQTTQAANTSTSDASVVETATQDSSNADAQGNVVYTITVDDENMVAQDIKDAISKGIIDAAAAKTLQDLYNLSKCNIVVVRTPNIAIQNSDTNTIVVSMKLLKVAEAQQVIRATAEQAVVEEISNVLPQEFINHIGQNFDNYINEKAVKNFASKGIDKKTLMVYYLLFDENFYDIVLNSSYDIGYKVAIALDRIVKKVNANTAHTKIQKVALNNILQSMRDVLKRYFILHANLDYRNVTVFTKTDLDYIDRNSVNAAWFNRLRFNKDVSAADIRKYQQLINSITVIDGNIATPGIKASLKSAIRGSLIERRHTLDLINKSLNYAFTTKFNDKIYLRNTSLPGNQLFNQFLAANNLTVDEVKSLQTATEESMRKYELKEMFKSYTKGLFDFDLNVDANGVTNLRVYSTKTSYSDAERLQSRRDDLTRLTFFDVDRSEFGIENISNSARRNCGDLILTPIDAADYNIIKHNLLSDEVSDIEAEYITIDDIIKNPKRYLKNELLDLIKRSNGDVTIDATYEVLSELFDTLAREQLDPKINVLKGTTLSKNIENNEPTYVSIVKDIRNNYKLMGLQNIQTIFYPVSKMQMKTKSGQSVDTIISNLVDKAKFDYNEMSFEFDTTTTIDIDMSTVIEASNWKKKFKNLSCTLYTSSSVNYAGLSISDKSTQINLSTLMRSVYLGRFENTPIDELLDTKTKVNAEFKDILKNELYTTLAHEFTHTVMSSYDISSGAYLNLINDPEVFAKKYNDDNKYAENVTKFILDFNKYVDLDFATTLIGEKSVIASLKNGQNLDAASAHYYLTTIAEFIYKNSAEQFAYGLLDLNYDYFVFDVSNSQLETASLLVTPWNAVYNTTTFEKIDSNEFNTATSTDTNIEQIGHRSEGIKPPNDEEYKMPAVFKGRYVSNTAALKTNLKYYIRKNQPIVLDKDLQTFIINASKETVPPSLWKLIYDGSLRTKWQAQRYFVKYFDKLTDEAFDLYNKTFFHNENIKSKEDLEKLIAIAQAAVGFSKVLSKDESFENFVTEKFSVDQIVSAIKSATSVKKFAAAINKTIEASKRYGNVDIDIADSDYMLAMMEDFDGTLTSLAKIGNTVRKGIYEKTLHSVNQSLERELGGKKGDDKTQTLEEKLQVTDIDYTVNRTKNPTDVVEDLVNEDFTHEEKVKFVSEWYYVNYVVPKLNKRIEKYGDAFNAAQQSKFIKNELNVISSKSEAWIDRAFDRLHNGMLVGENGRTIGFRDVNELRDSVARPRKNVVKHLKAIVNSIWNTTTPNQREKLPTDIRSMFDENGKLKSEYYVDKDMADLLEYEQYALSVKRDIQSGLYNKNQSTIKKYQATMKRLRERIEKLNRQNRQRKAKDAKAKTVTVKISDSREIMATSSEDYPPIVVELLNTAFGTKDKTTVQLFSSPDEEHLRLSMKEFFEANAKTLSSITEEQASQIIKFYRDLVLVTSLDTDTRRFQAYSAYILAYIQRQIDKGVFNLGIDDVRTIAEILKKYFQESGTGLAVAKNVVNYLKPEEIVVEQIAKSLGLEITDQEVSNLVTCVYQGDIDRLKQVEQFITDRLLQKRGKRAILDRISTFHRAMMLSNIGTVIRNKISNQMLYHGNKVADFLGRIVNKLPGKLSKKIEGQYDFTGVKLPSKSERATDKVWQFIQTNFIDNGFVDLLEGGLSRYDDYSNRRSSSPDETIAYMIRDNIKNKLMYDRHVVPNKNVGKALNALVDTIFKLQSDDKIIRKTAIEYFYKILVSENIDIRINHNSPFISMTGKIMQAFADAYSQASFDYMRKPTIFSKIENKLRNYNESAFYVYKLLFPFMSAGWNWFMESLNWSPVGLVKGIVSLLRAEKTIAKIDDLRAKGEIMPSSKWVQFTAKRNIGKGMLGTTILCIGILLGVAGIIDWDDEDEKMYIKIGSLKIDLTAITGTSALYVGATLVSKLGEEKYNFWKSLGEAANIALDQFFLTDFVNTVRYSGTKSIDGVLSKMVQGVINGFVPNFLRAVGNIFTFADLSYESGWIGTWQRFLTGWIPGLANARAFTEIDIYTGKPSMRPWYDIFLRSITQFTPFDVASDYFSDLELIARSYEINKGELTGEYEINDEDYVFDKKIINEKYGEYNNKMLTMLFENKLKVRVKNDKGNYVETTFSKMTDEQRKNAISNLMQKNSTYAKIYYWTQVENHKYYATDSEYVNLKRLGILKNVYRKTNRNEGFVK